MPMSSAPFSTDFRKALFMMLPRPGCRRASQSPQQAIMPLPRRGTQVRVLTRFVTWPNFPNAKLILILISKKRDYELLTQCNALDQRYERDGLILNDVELQEYLDRVGRSILPSSSPTTQREMAFFATA